MKSLSDSAVWHRLATAAGRDPDSFAPTRDWRKRTLTHDHIVQRYEGADEALILKRIYRPRDPKPFQTLVEAQIRAAEAMAGLPEAVPEVLEFDAAARAVLMRAAPGQTVYDLIAEGADAADSLRRAGRWIASFHRTSGLEPRTYQPRFMRNHVAHLLEEDRSGKIDLPKGAAFHRHGAAAIALAQHFEGRETLSAATHGDLHLRNILLDGDRSWGIDFSALHTAPVGFDIARFLLHYVGVFGDLDAVPRGEVIDPTLLAAFFECYDLVGPDDPSVQYLLRIRVLMDWAAIPARVLERSKGQGRRLRRLARLGDITFG
ncbi:phosphotransferase [Thalassococcus sp. BH17M4-6]|uniref:phosphotransferase n=1 Tax=Thalassococcus sp. BH17M4-6 TaxID=3413148 RepID=UPI003BE6D92C